MTQGLGVIPMAVLFQMVKRQQRAKEQYQQHEQASAMSGQQAYAEEQGARQRNLDSMRQQTKQQLAMSMGMNPMMMGDPAAHIARSAQRTAAPGDSVFFKPEKMHGLGMI